MRVYEILVAFYVKARSREAAEDFYDEVIRKIHQADPKRIVEAGIVDVEEKEALGKARKVRAGKSKRKV